jgi:hypothetical protein
MYDTIQIVWSTPYREFGATILVTESDGEVGDVGMDDNADVFEDIVEVVAIEGRGGLRSRKNFSVRANGYTDASG